MRVPYHRLAGAAILFPLALLACRTREAPVTAMDGAYERVYERGPVDITVRTDRTRLTVAGSVTLSLEAAVAEGYAVAFPEVGRIGQDFAVVDFGDDQPRLGDESRMLMRRWVILEPYLSGSYEIPAFTFTFARTDGSDSHRVVTDPVGMEIVSLLPEDYQSLEIQDIYSVRYPPRRFPLWLAIVGGGVLLAAAALWFLRSRRTPARLDRADPPHVIAYRELDALQEEDLPASGHVKLFYQKITGILRRYIENRFGLRAPELTTEEFLHEVQSTRVFEEEMKQMLQRFLEHCDLVKFAELRPDKEDIASTYSSCRRFVRATEPLEDRRAV